MEESTVEACSPLATVEDIQRRLLRPPPLHSPSSFSIPSISSPSGVFNVVKFSKPSAISTLICLISSCKISLKTNNLRKQSNSSSSTSLLPLIDLKKSNETLEDYLNPVLLSTIRAKFMKQKVDRVVETKQCERDYDHLFKWPIEQLNMFKDDSGSKRRRIEEEEAVNLGNDTDLIGEDEGCSDGDVCCTPFGKFEVMALKKFKGGG